MWDPDPKDLLLVEIIIYLANMMIHKNKGKFDVFIDGDKLDTFKTQKEAEKAGIAFAKEF